MVATKGSIVPIIIKGLTDIILGVMRFQSATKISEQKFTTGDASYYETLQHSTRTLSVFSFFMTMYKLSNSLQIGSDS